MVCFSWLDFLLKKNVVSATKENMEVNGIAEDQFSLIIGNIIDDKEVQDAAGYEKYDIVVANILADVTEFLHKSHQHGRFLFSRSRQISLSAFTHQGGYY